MSFKRSRRCRTPKRSALRTAAGPTRSNPRRRWQTSRTPSRPPERRTPGRRHRERRRRHARSTSKRRPQPRQEYSYSGIIALRNRSRGDPTCSRGLPRGRRHPWCGSIRSSGTARAGSLTWAPGGVASRTSGRTPRRSRSRRSPPSPPSRVPPRLALRIVDLPASTGPSEVAQTLLPFPLPPRPPAGSGTAHVGTPSLGSTTRCRSSHAARMPSRTRVLPQSLTFRLRAWRRVPARSPACRSRSGVEGIANRRADREHRRVVDAIVDVHSLAPAIHRSGPAQDGKMLGDVGLTSAHLAEDIADGSAPRL